MVKKIKNKSTHIIPVFSDADLLLRAKLNSPLTPAEERNAAVAQGIAEVQSHWTKFDRRRRDTSGVGPVETLQYYTKQSGHSFPEFKLG